MSLKRWAVCGAVVLAACGGDGKGSDFSDELRRNFLASCEESSGGDESACECLLDELESRMTEAEFVALEAEGEEVFLGDRRVQASESLPLASCLSRPMGSYWSWRVK